MTIAEFIQNIRLHGLEYFSKYYGTYKGFVAYNNDPDNMGRLRVCVPSIFGKNVPKYWALPRGLMTGKDLDLAFLPNVGDPIFVTFENGDCRFPLWEFGWCLKGARHKTATEDNAVIRFGENLIEMNKKTGVLQITNKQGQVIKLSATGVILGSENATEVAVLGTTLVTLLESLIDILAASTTTVLGVQVPLSSVSLLQALKLTVKTIKSTKVKLV